MTGAESLGTLVPIVRFSIAFGDSREAGGLEEHSQQSPLAGVVYGRLVAEHFEDALEAVATAVRVFIEELSFLLELAEFTLRRIETAPLSDAEPRGP